jgi:hypothetical protein
MHAIYLCNERTCTRGPDLDRAGAYLLMTVAGGSVGNMLQVRLRRNIFDFVGSG